MMGAPAFDFLIPDWPAPACVRALSTTRPEGESSGSYASMNLALHVGDDPQRVMANRLRLEQLVCHVPLWMQQVHGVYVANADAASQGVEADAAVARKPGKVCTVMTADCLPVLFCDASGQVVAAAHAGWRGLAGGVLENTLRAMNVDAAQVMAWLGPAISQQIYEVGEDVRTAFLGVAPQAASAFIPAGSAGKYFADLYALARQRLHAAGVDRIYGGEHCTYRESDTFFSARRDGVRSGRQASLIWLE